MKVMVALGAVIGLLALAPAAFAVLRRHSQHHNIKIAVLAEQLTTTGQLPGLDTTSAPGTPGTRPQQD